MLLVARPAARFTFTTPPPLTQCLSFAPILGRFQSTLTASLKRTRAPCDIDNTNTSRKKRRLRKLLITSRLSSPFSKPASHIVDRGNCKIAVWARQRHLGKTWLRKTAIMNSANRHLSLAAGNNAESCLPPSLRRSLALVDPDVTDGVLPPTSVAIATTPSTMALNPATANTRKRRTSFEEDKAVHLAPKPPKRRSMPVMPRKVISSTSPNLAPATHVRPSPLGLTDYNYDALDDDSYNGYDAADEAETFEYMPHPDFVEKPQSSWHPPPPIGITDRALCEPASALPSPSPSPPGNRAIPPPSSFFGCDTQLNPLEDFPSTFPPFPSLPPTAPMLAPSAIAAAATTELPVQLAPAQIDLDFDFRTWLNHESRPPSPPEEEILALLRGSLANQTYFF